MMVRFRKERNSRHMGYVRRVFLLFKFDKMSHIIEYILVLTIMLIMLAILLAGLRDHGYLQWFKLLDSSVVQRLFNNISAVSFCISIVALSNTVLGFLNSERGRYGFNQFELLSLALSKPIIVCLQLESVLCAFLAFFALIFQWRNIECACIIGCVISVFVFVLLWIFFASERYTKQCIYSVVLKDCLDDYYRRSCKKKKGKILSENAYCQKDIKNIFGKRIYRLIDQARLDDRYTLDMVMESSFRAIGKTMHIICEEDEKEYYYKKLYGMVFVFIKTLHENAGENYIYVERLYELIQDVLENNEGFWGSFRFAVVSAIFHETCRYINRSQQLPENDKMVLQSDFFGVVSRVFKECIRQKKEYIIGDIYTFLEMYSHDYQIPDPAIRLLVQNKVDYETVNKRIKESKQLYLYCFSELSKLKILKRNDTERMIQTLTSDMDAYINKFDYLCKSNIMRNIQIRR